MSNNTYWGSVPETITDYAPGEYADNYGQENDEYAIQMGEVLVEGTPEQWRAFAYAVLDKLGNGETVTAHSYRCALRQDHEGKCLDADGQVAFCPSREGNPS